MLRFEIILSITLLSTVACSGPPPAIMSLELDPHPSEATPLVARASLVTNQPTTVSFSINDGVRDWVVDTRSAAATEHTLPVLGLRPGRTHQIRAIVTNESGQTATSDAVEVTTDPLPEEFPPITLTVSIPERMEPGVTLVEPSYQSEDGTERKTQWLIAVDESGEVVWYYKADHNIGDTQRIANGNFLYRSGNTHIYEIDIYGKVLNHWIGELTPEEEITPDSIRVPVPTLHHEMFETPSGTIMALSTEVRSYDNYPTSETDPNAPHAKSDIIGDRVIEFTRKGEILRDIHVADLLDPYRIGYASLGPFWAQTYKRNDVRDWSHANGISLDETGRYLLLSMRNQSTVAKIDLETNSLVWLLGEHKSWKPQWQSLLLAPKGNLIWNAGQHAPMYTPEGTVLVFDNGTSRAIPFDPRMPPAESFSRAAEYRIDESNMTVEEVWSYGGPPDERYYAWRVGDADWMPKTGNVLITYGGLTRDKSDTSAEGAANHHWIRMVEVTHTVPAEKVFEFFIDDKRPNGWISFQGERIPGLYP